MSNSQSNVTGTEPDVHRSVGGFPAVPTTKVLAIGRLLAPLTPYDYPWCAQYNSRFGSGALSCYYTSFQQCMATMSGIGGNCIRNPYYGQGPSQRSPARYQRY